MNKQTSFLESSNAFSSATIENVSQFRQDFLAKDLELADVLGDQHELRTIDGQRVYDPRDAWLYDSNPNDADAPVELHFSSLGNPLNLHNIMRYSLYRTFDPDTRIIVTGQPGVPFLFPQGSRISKEGRKNISNGELAPLNEKVLQVLEEKDIASVALAGYSLGANLAFSAAEVIGEQGGDVRYISAFEPPSTNDSYSALASLSLRFIGAGSKIGAFAEQGGSELYKKLSKKDAIHEIGPIGYGIGLLRPTNIAAIRSFKKTDPLQMVSRTASEHPATSIAVFYGDRSEVVDSEAMNRLKEGSQSPSRAGRLAVRQLDGGMHAMNEDIFLALAMVVEARSLANQI